MGEKRKCNDYDLYVLLPLCRDRCDLRRMGSNGGEDILMSEPTIEIKVKTLDSQTYTLKVDKEVSTLASSRIVQ